MLKFSYDEDVDILYVQLDDVKARRAKGAELPFSGAYADLAEDGTILGIEIPDASLKYPMEELRRHPPNYHEPLPLADAARIAGTSVEAMRKAILRGRLGGKRIGRNWVTSIHELKAYLNSRAHAGPGSAAADEAAAG